MKRSLLVIGLVGLIICWGTTLYAAIDDGEREQPGINADEMSLENTPVNKFERGAINTVTFWAEVPAAVCKVSQERDPVLGMTVGVVQGTVTAVARGVTGIVDMFTCAAPPYNKPSMHPEYALTHADNAIKSYFW